MHALRQPHAVTNQISFFSAYFCTIVSVLSLIGDYAVRFSVPDGTFYIVIMGWIFLQQLIYVRIQNIEERAITIGRRTAASMRAEDENKMDSGMLKRSRCVLFFQ